MSEIKHTMPDVIYADKKRTECSEELFVFTDTKSYGIQFATSYTRTDIVQELVEANSFLIDTLRDLVVIAAMGKTKDIDWQQVKYIVEHQQALNKAKGLGDD